MLEWLQEDFLTRVISRKSSIPRPTDSSSLNFLEYWLWLHALDVVIDKNSEHLTELMDTVAGLCQILSEA